MEKTYSTSIHYSLLKKAGRPSPPSDGHRPTLHATLQRPHHAINRNVSASKQRSQRGGHDCGGHGAGCCHQDRQRHVTVRNKCCYIASLAACASTKHKAQVTTQSDIHVPLKCLLVQQ